MLSIFNKYNPNANPATPDYPNGSGKDESVAGSNDGTPLEMDWYNDMVGFSESLLAQGRLTPSGNADTALTSDRLDALRLATLRVQTACDYTDGDLSRVDVIYVGLDVSTVDYVIDRNSLTRWSTDSTSGTISVDNLNTSTGIVSGVSGALTQIEIGTAAALDTGTSSGNVSINEYLPCDNSLGFRSARAVANNSDLDLYTENGVYSLAITLSPNKPPQLGTLSVAAMLTVKRVGRGDLVQVRQTLEIVSFNRTFVRYIGLDWEEIVTDASGYGIGIEQTVQDVTASRLINVTYTNTTGKTIVVYISMSPPNDVGTIEVDGIPILNTQTRTGDSLISYTFLVPNGSTYRQNTSAFNRWTELR